MHRLEQPHPVVDDREALTCWAVVIGSRSNRPRRRSSAHVEPSPSCAGAGPTQPAAERPPPRALPAPGRSARRSSRSARLGLGFAVDVLPSSATETGGRGDGLEGRVEGQSTFSTRRRRAPRAARTRGWRRIPPRSEGYEPVASMRETDRHNARIHEEITGPSDAAKPPAAAPIASPAAVESGLPAPLIECSSRRRRSLGARGSPRRRRTAVRRRPDGQA